MIIKRHKSSSWLPSILLRQIFRILVSEHKTYELSLKTVIRLLAVNRQWRAEALPYAYNKVFITNGIYSYANNKSIQTNIDLVKSTNNSNLVKEIHIVSRIYQNFDEFLNNMEALLEFDLANWLSVTSIYFENNIHIGWHQIDRSIISKLCYFKTRLINNMPGIRKLEFSCNSPFTTSVFEAPLVNTFANQLTSLVCHHSIDIEANCSFRNITCLDIPLDSKMINILQSVDTESLTKLCLRYISVNNLWCYFNKCTSARVDFTQLKELNLTFSDAHRDNKSTLACGHSCNNSKHGLCYAFFPKLSHLRIKNTSGSLKYTHAGIFGSHLNRLVFEGTADDLETINKSNVETIANAFISFTKINTGDVDKFYTTTNYTLTKYGIMGKCQLELPARGFELDLDKINWADLKSIIFRGQVNYQLFLSLLVKIPHLLHISLGSLGFDRIALNTLKLDYGDYNHTQVGSSRPKLKALTIHSVAVQNSSVTAEFVKQFLLLTPSLRILIMYMAEELGVPQYVQKHESRYPHLVSLKINGYSNKMRSAKQINTWNILRLFFLNTPTALIMLCVLVYFSYYNNSLFFSVLFLLFVFKYIFG